MPKPYDNVTRFLNTFDPRAWTNLFGIKASTVEARDTDLSTVASQADGLTVIDNHWALHLENQASYKADMGDRLLEYNVLATKSLKMPVRSVVILLRPEADGPAMNGVVQRHLADNTKYLDFKFEVVRVWEISVDTFLNAGIGVLPFSFIANVPPKSLPSVVDRAKARLRSNKIAENSGGNLDCHRCHHGLRYPRTTIDNVLRGVGHMEESVTYQAIIEKGIKKGMERGVLQGFQKGRAEGRQEGSLAASHSLALKIGTRFLGKPSESILAKLNKITQKSRLEKLALRAPLVSSWDELFK